MSEPTPPTIIVEQTWQQRFVANAEAKLKSGSFYVVTAGGVVLTYLLERWQAMQPGDQAALLGQFAPWQGVLSLVVGYVVTALRPSNALSQQTRDLLHEITRLSLNVALVRAGKPEIPPLKTIAVPPAAANIAEPAVITAQLLSPKPDAETVFEAPQPQAQADIVRASLASVRAGVSPRPNPVLAEATAAQALNRYLKQAEPGLPANDRHAKVQAILAQQREAA